MRVLLFCLGLLASFVTMPAAEAQEQAWLQVEAQPSLAGATERARAYASRFPDVEGYQTGSGWYAIVLGPMTPGDAAARLLSLRRANLIPRDSFLSDGSAHGQRFWPAGLPTELVTEPTTEPLAADSAIEQTAIAPEPPAEPVVVALPEETQSQARAAEDALDRDAKMALQTALQWFGHYDSAIDGAFGAVTRKSMAGWQAANGFDPTSVLTTRQRGTLIANQRTDQAEFGFETITEAQSGIEITLPMALLAFDHYEPPFVHYAEKNGSGLRVILISQPGDGANLAGLYDILQTLVIVPPDGERALQEKSFTINAVSADVQSFAYAEAGRGQVKGYLAVWNPADQARMARILPVLKASFRGVGDKALDPGLVPMTDTTRRGLLSGLEVRKPRLSRSGFFITADGLVLTSIEAVTDCGRVTLNRDTAATVTLTDPALGIAVLTPAARLGPPSVAEFSPAPGRIGAAVAVSGYSYEDALPAPVLTFGTLEDLSGLDGTPGLTRIAVPVLPGDAGGPVLDGSGAVLGMLLPAPSGARQLPEGVAFAVPSDLLVARLAQAGVSASTAANSATASPDALSAKGLGMTVLVSCWD